MCATRRRWSGAICLIALCSACFRTTAPPGWLPTPDAADTDAYGGWIRVEQPFGSFVEGELLAATPDTIHLLTDSDGWKAIPLTQVRRATLTGYAVDYQPIVLEGVVGTLATISHGFILILTAPAWILTSTLSASSASRSPRVSSTSPSALNLYARFPQGLPSGIDRTSIRGKRPPSR